MQQRRYDKFKNLSEFQKYKKVIRDKIYLFIRRIIDIRYHKKLLEYTELNILLNNLSEAKNKITGSGPRTADISDCLALYEDVLKLKPNFILELGPGSSTAAICLAISIIKRNNPSYSPVFIAVESQKYWLDFYMKNIPDNLLENVSMILRNELTKDFKGKKVAYYDNLPIYPYEFIHVDGPDIHGLGVDLQSDLITLEKHLSDECLIIFDGRRNASRFSRNNMSKFNFRRHSKTLNHMISKTNIKNGFIFDFLKRN